MLLVLHLVCKLHNKLKLKSLFEKEIMSYGRSTHIHSFIPTTFLNLGSADYVDSKSNHNCRFCVLDVSEVAESTVLSHFCCFFTG